MKIALVENFGADFIGARLRLAIYLQKKGVEVTAIIPKDGNRLQIEEAGIRVLEVGANIRSKGLKVKYEYAKRLRLILKEENFDLVHFFRLQPNVIGTFVAGLTTDSKIINHVTGLGVAYVNKSMKNRVLQFLIGSSYKLNKFFFNPHIIYQNKYDSYDLGIVKNTSCIEGSAVNEDKFNFNFIKSQKIELEKIKDDLNIIEDDKEKIFIFVSRLLKEKGVLELIEGFKLAQAESTKKIRLLIVGWSDTENPSAVSANELKLLIKNSPRINFLGKRSDVQNLLAISHVSILPTYYREGTPRFLLESMVMKNAIITTDMPGCNHLVSKGENGLLIEPKSSLAVKNAVLEILNKDLEKLGEEGSKLYFEKFSEDIVYSKILNLYKVI